MNYYEHHLGDWAAATGHLTWDEDMAYTRLLRAYYHAEKPIPTDQGYRLAKASTPAQRRAVDAVLQEFFTLEADGWHQKRTDAEIARFKASEPEREAKKANEDTRLKRHREERARLFKVLTDAGQHAAWNITMNELRELVKRCGPPLPATAPATPATATQTQTQTPYPGLKEKPPNPRKRGNVHEFPPGFDAFWLAYPRKTAKPKAAQAFARLAPDAALMRAILAAVESQCRSEQWTKDGGQFIPHPATWISGRRWEDRIDALKATGTDLLDGAH